MDQLCRICGMEHLPPFVVHGTHTLTVPEISRHAEDYRRVLTAIRDDRIDWKRPGRFPGSIRIWMRHQKVIGKETMQGEGFFFPGARLPDGAVISSRSPTGLDSGPCSGI